MARAFTQKWSQALQCLECISMDPLCLPNQKIIVRNNFFFNFCFSTQPPYSVPNNKLLLTSISPLLFQSHSPISARQRAKNNSRFQIFYKIGTTQRRIFRIFVSKICFGNFINYFPSAPIAFLVFLGVLGSPLQLDGRYEKKKKKKEEEKVMIDTMNTI